MFSVRCFDDRFTSTCHREQLQSILLARTSSTQTPQKETANARGCRQRTESRRHESTSRHQFQRLATTKRRRRQRQVGRQRELFRLGKCGAVRGSPHETLLAEGQ